MPTSKETNQSKVKELMQSASRMGSDCEAIAGALAMAAVTKVEAEAELQQACAVYDDLLMQLMKCLEGGEP